MTLEQYAYLAEIIGTTVVVITLIFLVVQLRQNTASVRANTYQGWSAANVGINAAMSNPAQSQIMMDGNLDPTSLTRESVVTFGMMNIALMQMAQSTDYLFRAGALDRELWESEMNRAAGILAIPGVRQWWDAGGRTQLTPSFVKRLEATRSTIQYWNWNSDQGFFASDHIAEPPRDDKD